MEDEGAAEPPKHVCISMLKMRFCWGCVGSKETLPLNSSPQRNVPLGSDAFHHTCSSWCLQQYKDFEAHIRCWCCADSKAWMASKYIWHLDSENSILSISWVRENRTVRSLNLNILSQVVSPRSSIDRKRENAWSVTVDSFTIFTRQGWQWTQPAMPAPFILVLDCDDLKILKYLILIDSQHSGTCRGVSQRSASCHAWTPHEPSF